MADLSDVTAYLAQAATAAIYPNGTASPSVAGVDVHIFEGWPLREKLEPDVQGGKPEVSIYPIRGSGSAFVVPQRLDRQQTLVAPVHGMTATVSDESVAVAGAPGTGEYLTITVDRANTYSRAGASIALILAAIAADAATAYPEVSVSGSTITFPGAFALSARPGAPGVAARITHWQRQPVQITVWAPSNEIRSAIAAAIDVALKSELHISLADGSQALIRYSSTTIDDAQVNAGIFRRDLIYDVEYATLDTYAVSEVTSLNVPLDVGPSLIGHVEDVAVSSQGASS